jgi:hypothetical protein
VPALIANLAVATAKTARAASAEGGGVVAS